MGSWSPGTRDLHRNGGLDLVDELAVEGDTAAHIEAEGERDAGLEPGVFILDKWCTSVLVHVKRKMMVTLKYAWRRTPLLFMEEILSDLVSVGTACNGNRNHCTGMLLLEERNERFHEH